MQVTRKRYKRTAVLSGIVLCALAAPAGAQSFPDYKRNNEWNPTPQELLRLPPHCQGAFLPNMAHITKAMHANCGPNFNHYCPGLVALNRSGNMLGTAKQRSQILEVAVRALRGVRAKMLPTCGIAQEVIAAEQLAQMRYRNQSRKTH